MTDADTILDCKTVGFFSKSVKKSVKRGVRVLRARSARASHARRACEAGEKYGLFCSLTLYVFLFMFTSQVITFP